MYRTKEEIQKKYVETQDSYERDFLIAHMFTEMMLENKREEATEEEYFEALIFVTCIMSYMSSDGDMKKSMIAKLCLYAAGNYILWVNIQDVEKFILKRYTDTIHEIKTMESVEAYLTPILVSNLYVNPMNEDRADEPNADFMTSVKYASLFRTKYEALMNVLTAVAKS